MLKSIPKRSWKEFPTELFLHGLHSIINDVYIQIRRYSTAATAGVGKIEGGTIACDHGLSFKSLSRATPCISSLKKRFLSPVVENKYLSRAVSLFWRGEEYFYWLIKYNQPMRIFLAKSSRCCYVNITNERYSNPCKSKWLGISFHLLSFTTPTHVPR